MTQDEALRALGAALAAREAEVMADALADGESLTGALGSIGANRRPQLRALMEAAELGPGALPLTLAVLRAIEGAQRRESSVAAVWTMAGSTDGYGHLTSSIDELVRSARTSVVCSTYNFSPASSLWSTLANVAAGGVVSVTIHVDGEVANPATIAAQMPLAKVFASKTVAGKHVRNHAKFVSIDHRFLVVTSANFSEAAELHNVELGLRLDDAPLVQSIESRLAKHSSHVYRLAS